MRVFEQTFFDIISNVVRYLKTQPINLGGYAASGGGAGGPPGGFFGYLPQTRVAYDLSELATLSTPSSGASLLDNLNHIRYRLSTVEGSGVIGINAYEDGVLVAEHVQNVDFVDRFSITGDTSGITVALLGSGVLSDTPTSGVFGENLTPQIDGIDDHFTVAGTIHDSSLALYLNGLRENPSTFTLDPDRKGFTTAFVPISGDTLYVDYLEEMDAYIHTHHQYALSGDVYTKEEVLQLLLAFSRTVNQQMILTVVGSGVLVSGTDPIRIYAHDVNAGATIQKVLVGFNTPPASEVRVNILKNGSTIFDAPSYVTIASGAYTGSRSTGFFDNTFVEDDYFQLKIEKGDSVGRDMSVHIRFSYELD